MRYLTALILLFSGLQWLPAQSVAELEARFNRSSSKTERLNFAYQIAEKSLAANNAKKASDFAMRANQLAVEVGDKRREADAAVLAADAEYRLRNYKEAAGRFNRAWNTSRNYGFRDLVLISSEKLQDIAMKQNDMKEALKWSTETVKYLKESGGGVRGGGESLRKLENQLAAAEADNRSLREQLAAATGQTQLLQNTYQSQLKEVEEKSQMVISEKDAALSQASQTAIRADSAAKVYSLRVKNLTEDQMIDSIVKAQQERELQEKKTRLAEAELLREQSENMRNVLALVVVFVFFLALLFYARFRAKKRMANELTQKNALIEEEQKRSNNLLLNILPPAIAEELKTRNKVAARKYDQATVMFVDFKGFTNVAERLSPERLVEELDLCFSNFDQIISKYRIEKIKTVGDAYICASGLSDMNASPTDMVKAALEMQDFLLGLKAERMSQGLPYFDARVGIHTGPVVAGVVGAKKFAYDIWGDTVNTAARLEEQCEPGRVNVSEDAYWLAKYEFEWQHRGKIPAKNKGTLDMYYVTGIKQY
ncbi:MAG TPA: adenylate/guanylate cyclase domain-containing protein [Saprospiraceae bacterium]|nr:adenylate/guanylate cyclase domain-containing protein [Saprospiraceae bacterium]